MKIKGIDVSDNQKNINWGKVKKAGVEFAILRTVRRSGTIDKQLASNIIGCLDAGIPFDFYKYGYATTESAAMVEAQQVINTLLGYGVNPSKETIIWYDVEDKVQISLSTEKLTKIVETFKRAVEDAGFVFGLYMGKCAYEKGEVDLSKFSDHTWIARYYKGESVFEFSNEPNKDYAPTAKTGTLWGWQYTSKGKVDGISGYVDLNVAYYDIKQTKVSPEYYKTPEFTLIDNLNKIGVDSSYKSRKEIAKKNGIKNYSGTAEQNKDLLEKLKNGSLLKV